MCWCISIILAPQHRKQEKNLFLQRPQFFFLATFTIVLIVFIYIFALLSHCNYLHLEKQLCSVLIIKHLGETAAAAATLHRFVPPAISLSIYKYYSFVLAPSGLFTPLSCVSVFFLCSVFFFHSSCSSSAQSCNLLSTDCERYAAVMQRCSGRDPVH